MEKYKLKAEELRLLSATDMAAWLYAEASDRFETKCIEREVHKLPLIQRLHPRGTITLLVQGLMAEFDLLSLLREQGFGDCEHKISSKIVEMGSSAAIKKARSERLKTTGPFATQ